MECFNHTKKEAAAIYMAGAPACWECGIDSEYGVACQQSCSRLPVEKNELYAQQTTHLKTIKRMNLLGSFFSIGVGFLFIYFPPRGSDPLTILFFF